MSYDSIRARLNLYAVLPNLEDVVRDDPEMRALVGQTRIIVRFLVAGGPTAWVRLADGVCTVGRGAGPGVDRLEVATDPADPGAAAGASPDSIPSVVLSFASAAHLNKMFDGTGSPIPLWGFNHLGFLRGAFTELTERMAYYLAPTDELLSHAGYLAMNTQLTLNTAAYAVPELLARDPECIPLRRALGSGTIVLKVLPDGPAVSLVCGASAVTPVKGELPHPSALVLMRDVGTANAFLNGKLDTFVAAVTGDVQIWGQIDKVDALALVLDRIPKYLTPAT